MGPGPTAPAAHPGLSPAASAVAGAGAEGSLCSLRGKHRVLILGRRKVAASALRTSPVFSPNCPVHVRPLTGRWTGTGASQELSRFQVPSSRLEAAEGSVLVKPGAGGGRAPLHSGLRAEATLR
jgi:hypothetical protein